MKVNSCSSLLPFRFHPAAARHLAQFPWPSRQAYSSVRSISWRPAAGRLPGEKRGENVGKTWGKHEKMMKNCEKWWNTMGKWWENGSFSSIFWVWDDVWWKEKVGITLIILIWMNVGWSDELIASLVILIGGVYILLGTSRLSCGVPVLFLQSNLDDASRTKTKYWRQTIPKQAIEMGEHLAAEMFLNIRQMQYPAWMPTKSQIEPIHANICKQWDCYRHWPKGAGLSRKGPGEHQTGWHFLTPSHEISIWYKSYFTFLFFIGFAILTLKPCAFIYVLIYVSIYNLGFVWPIPVPNMFQPLGSWPTIPTSSTKSPNMLWFTKRMPRSVRMKSSAAEKKNSWVSGVRRSQWEKWDSWIIIIIIIIIIIDHHWPSLTIIIIHFLLVVNHR